MRIYLQNHEKFGTVISAKNLGGPLAKSEKIAEDQEKALHFPGKDDTFFNSENAYLSRFACTSVNGHRKRGDACRPFTKAGKTQSIHYI